jgi:hypothetical protein
VARVRHTDLREHGVNGVQIVLNGPHFRMSTEPRWTDRCELRCRGTVNPDGTGSIIQATTRQDNPALWMVAILAVFLAVNVARERTWSAVAQALGILLLIWLAATAMMLLARRQARHRAEAAEFERILERIAWPPSGSASPRVAV